MGLIDDFERAQFSTRSIMLYYLLMIPMFFISIYLFKPSMIHIIQGNPFINLHFFFLVSVCLMLSTLWLVMVYFITAFTVKHIQKIELEKQRQARKRQFNENLKSIARTSFDKDAFKKQYQLFRDRTTNRVQNNNRIRNEYSNNSKYHYSLTLIYSVGYFGIALAINYYWLKLSLIGFLISLSFFILFRGILLHLRLKHV